MNATDCARAAEPHSRTARHKARLKLTARRLACTSANIATILSRAYHPYKFRGRGAVRIVTYGSCHRAQLKSNALPPRPAPRSLKPRQNCFRLDIVKVATPGCQAVKADFSRATSPDRER